MIVNYRLTPDSKNVIQDDPVILASNKRQCCLLVEIVHFNWGMNVNIHTMIKNDILYVWVIGLNLLELVNSFLHCILQLCLREATAVLDIHSSIGRHLLKPFQHSLFR